MENGSGTPKWIPLAAVGIASGVAAVVIAIMLAAGGKGQVSEPDKGPATQPLAARAFHAPHARPDEVPARRRHPDPPEPPARNPAVPDVPAPERMRPAEPSQPAKRAEFSIDDVEATNAWLKERLRTANRGKPPKVGGSELEDEQLAHDIDALQGKTVRWKLRVSQIEKLDGDEVHVATSPLWCLSVMCVQSAEGVDPHRLKAGITLPRAVLPDGLRGGSQVTISGTIGKLVYRHSAMAAKDYPGSLVLWFILTDARIVDAQP
jgi:hypothetical protein